MATENKYAIGKEHEAEMARIRQKGAEDFTKALGTLLGVNVVSKTEYDKVNIEKEKLLHQTKDAWKLAELLIRTQCKLQGFVQYHKKWKPTTRNFEKRLKKLQSEKLYQDFKDYPEDIADNLKEAYNCYINGMNIACYIMILRTIEIAVNLIYEKHNPIEYEKNGKPKYIPIKQKLEWVKKQRMIGGADYTLAQSFIEARNDSIHDIFKPTDKQLFSAFEGVINLILKLKEE